MSDSRVNGIRQKLLYIEDARVLYRGFGRGFPAIVWRPADGSWQAYADDQPKPDDWGQLVSTAEAERLHPGSTTAPLPLGIEPERTLSVEEFIEMRPELFDGYDGPVTRHSPEEIHKYRDAVRQRFQGRGTKHDDR